MWHFVTPIQNKVARISSCITIRMELCHSSGIWANLSDKGSSRGLQLQTRLAHKEPAQRLVKVKMANSNKHPFIHFQIRFIVNYVYSAFRLTFLRSKAPLRFLDLWDANPTMQVKFSMRDILILLLSLGKEDRGVRGGMRRGRWNFVRWNHGCTASYLIFKTTFLLWVKCKKKLYLILALIQFRFFLIFLISESTKLYLETNSCNSIIACIFATICITLWYKLWGGILCKEAWTFSQLHWVAVHGQHSIMVGVVVIKNNSQSPKPFTGLGAFECFEFTNNNSQVFHDKLKSLVYND